MLFTVINSEKQKQEQETDPIWQLPVVRYFSFKSDMTSPAKSPHFFKFILSRDVQSTGLRIPKNFMRHHGKNLSTRVLLKVPGGGLWQVKLANSKNGEVWLKEGWRKFAEHYNIVYKRCLVFRYEGNSIFHVIIFDPSASEIEYPTSTEPGTEIDDDSTRKKSPVTYFQCGKKMKPNSKSEEVNRNGGLYEGTETNIGMKAVKTEEDTEEEDDKSDFATEWKQQASDNEKAEALRSAQAFKPDNPSFMVTMHPSYVNGKMMSVPLAFVQKYLNAMYNNCVLQVKSKGRTWLVKYMVYDNVRNAKLGAGWKPFVLDNSLIIGDVCVFELIDDVENLLRVHVFRASNGNNNVRPDFPIEKKPNSCDIERAKAMDSARAFESENHSFIVRMKPSYLDGRFGLNIPKNFAETYLNREHNNCALQLSNGSTWLLKYMVYPHNSKIDSG